MTEPRSRCSWPWRTSEPFVSWPFWVTLLVGAGVGFYRRDWADVVLACVPTYVVLATTYLLLARRFGWRRLSVSELLGNLVIFLSG